MCKITNIIKYNKNKHSIFLDGSFFCVLNDETIIKEKIFINKTISKQNLEKIQLENEKIDALNKCLKLLAVPKTKKQIIDHLYLKGYSNLTVNHCINKLEEYGYINDENFAKLYLESYKNKKGKRLLEFELKTKGVSEEIITNVFKNFFSSKEAIENIAKKYLKNKEKNISTAKKLSQHLLMKGFTFSEINPILKNLIYDLGDENEGWD